ncbi:DNA gyrase subunit A [bacterium]|nr:DNA gyrase subunit A [bacterium]
MPIEDRDLVPVAVVDEMKDAYMDYAMSVIVSRALPDARDGLKPVHRRILYTMREENITPDRPFKKSASTVGNVLARYHPHGDLAVYDTLVRMAQPFNLRYMLVQGHGNFGSVDGDNAAAMRYTEARLSKIAMMMLEDLDKDTVDWRPNFDASLQEPVVLPNRIPNLLLNGSDGIAVGMATKIPPHNLNELIDGCVMLLENAETDIDELNKVIPGPDFPTGATILGRNGIREAYRTGRGSIIMRAKIDVEDMKRGDRKQLVVTEIPFQVNKSRLQINIAEAIKEKRIEGISDMRDESDRKGMRIVFELSSGAHPEVVMNQLYKYSELQTTFGVNMLALVNGVPRVLNLREMLLEFVNHRRVVVRRRSQFLLDKALKRDHIVQGLLKALDHIDEIIKLIRASADGNEARTGLMTKFDFTEPQAQAILDMRLQRLTGLERDKLQNEHEELLREITYLQGLLEDPVKLDGVVRDEMIEVKTLFGDERRTEIVAFAGELNIEDLIAEEKMVVTISQSGYIKRVPYDTYRTQKRGGRGVSGTALKEEDSLEHLFVSSTHHHILFFTNRARVFRMKVHEIQEYSRTAKGTPLVNLLPIQEQERVASIIPVRSFEDPGTIVTCTREGIIKRTDLEAYSRINSSGLIALTLKEGDELVSVKLTPGNQDLILVTQNGMAIRFNEEDARTLGRTAQGVKGIDLREGDMVVAMDSVTKRESTGEEAPAEEADAPVTEGDEAPTSDTTPGEKLLVVSINGYGKRTLLDQYPTQGRGGKGLKTLQMTEKTGHIVGAMVVDDHHEFMVSTLQGTLIKLAVADVSCIGRATQGVRVIRLGEGDLVGAVTRIIPETEEESEEETDGDEEAVPESDAE